MLLYFLLDISRGWLYAGIGYVLLMLLVYFIQERFILNPKNSHRIFNTNMIFLLKNFSSILNRACE